MVGRDDCEAETGADELGQRVGQRGVLRAAYRLLRAFLHALRDRITVDEAAQLAAQLPELVRGSSTSAGIPAPRLRSTTKAEPFLRRIAEEARLGGTAEASLAATGAASVLRSHVSEGEIADVLAVRALQRATIANPASVSRAGRT